MNIACDARALAGPITGVGTWVTQVMGRLAAAGEHVMLATPRPLIVPQELDQPRISVLPAPALTLPGTLWLHSHLAGQLAVAGAEVFVAALGIMPRRCPIPAVVVLHDLTPRSHPHRHTLANRFCFNAYLEESLDRAAAVVTGSRATQAEALVTFPWLRSRLLHIADGVDEFFSPPPPGADGSATRQRFAGGESFVLHLGTLEPRKGLLDLVAAWEQLQHRVPAAPALVLAGAPGWQTGPLLSRIAASPQRERIHLPGYVSRSEARDLLRHASCFVLASEAEGFGLPLAEAISCGTPAVASDIPALVEVAGGACLHVPPHAPAALAVAIAQALDAARAGELRRRALERAPQLRWQPVVAAWQELLAAVIRDRRAPQPAGSARES